MNHPVESSNKNPESLGISYLYTYSSNIYSQAGFLGVCLILVTFLPKYYKEEEDVVKDVTSLEDEVKMEL